MLCAITEIFSGFYYNLFFCAHTVHMLRRVLSSCPVLAMMIASSATSLDGSCKLPIVFVSMLCALRSSVASSFINILNNAGDAALPTLDP